MHRMAQKDLSLLFIPDVLAALVYDRLTQLAIHSSIVHLDISSSYNSIFHPPLLVPFWAHANRGRGEVKQQVSR